MSIRNNIEKLVVIGAGQRFKGRDFRDLRKPGVYIFLLDGQPLYVGMSSMLLRRIGSLHKQAQIAMDSCDRVLVYPCVSAQAAKELESILISKLQPKYNWRQRSKIVSDTLGCSNQTASLIQCEARDLLKPAG